MTWKLLCGPAAALSIGVAMPAVAQNSDAPVDVTAAPPATSETVGPAQLRDFNLKGTVTRPAERPADTGARPTTNVTPEPANVTLSVSANDQPAGRAQPAPARTPPIDSTATATRDPAPSTPPPPAASSLPLEVSTNAAPQPGFTELTPAATVPVSPDDLSAPWPWLAALLALVGGAAFIAWTRRNRRGRYADPGRMAFAGPAPDVAPESRPLPPARPRPDPVPPVARPAPVPTPRPDPVPKPAAKPADDGLIVSRGLRPRLGIEFLPDRLVVTGSDVVLQFDVVITNSGSAPARDVLVEAKMFTAHAGQDREIAAFFQNPIGSGDRIPAVVPLGKLSLKSAVRMPFDQLHSFQVEGRKLFVPLVGFNVLFRTNGGDEQASGSFLVGRGSEQDEKLGPFRIDLGPRVFRGLAARTHSMGLQPA